MELENNFKVINLKDNKKEEIYNNSRFWIIINKFNSLIDGFRVSYF